MRDKEIYQHISAKIREARKEKKMKQEHLAAIIDISRPSYVNIERNKQCISIDKVYLIAHHLGKDIGYFFPGMAEAKVEAKVDAALRLKLPAIILRRLEAIPLKDLKVMLSFYNRIKINRSVK